MAKIKLDVGLLYYFKSDELLERHTQNSHGKQIDLKQVLAAKKEIFIEQAPEPTREKKKIILSGWYLNRELTLYFDALKELKELGFELYLCVDKELHLIANFAARPLKNLQYHSESEARNIAAAHGFTNDEIYIIGPLGFHLLEVNDKEFVITAKELSKIAESPQALANLEAELANNDSIKKCLYIDTAIGPSIDKCLPFINAISIQQYIHPYILNNNLIKAINCKSISFEISGDKSLDKEVIDISAIEFPNGMKLNYFRVPSLYISSYFLYSPIFHTISWWGADKLELSCFNQDNFNKFLDAKFIVFSELRITASEISFASLSRMLSSRDRSINSLVIKTTNFKGEITDLEIPDEITKISFIKPTSFNEIKAITQKAKKLKELIINKLIEEPIEEPKVKSIFVHSLEKTLGYNENYLLPQTTTTISLLNSKVDDKTYREILSLPNLKKLDLIGCKRPLPEDINISEGLELIYSEYMPDSTINISNYFQGDEINRETAMIDGNTENSKKVLYATKIFKDKHKQDEIPVSDYRKTGFTTYDEYTGIVSCFSLPDDYEEIDIEQKVGVVSTYHQKYQESANHFLGKFTFTAEGQLIQLPSLTPHDQLIEFEIQSKNTPVHLPYKLFYCKKNNFYCLDKLSHANINANEDQVKSTELTIYYILKSPYYAYESKSILQYANKFISAVISAFYSHSPITNLLFTANNRLNDERLYRLDEATKLNLVIDYFNGFKAKPLSRKPNDKDIKDTINLILQEKAGVCRHGAFTLFAVLQELEIKSTLIENDVHTYVEVYLNDDRVKKLHTGGSSDVQIKINSAWSKADDTKSSYSILAEFLTKLAKMVAIIGPSLALLLRFVPNLNLASFQISFQNNNINDFSNHDAIANHIADSNHDDSTKSYIPSLANLMLTMAAIGSAALMVKMTQYFYNQEQKNKKLLLSSDAQKTNIVQQTTIIQPKPKKSNQLVKIKVSNPKKEKTFKAPQNKLIEAELPKANPFIAEIANQFSNAKNIKEYVNEVITVSRKLEKKNILCIMKRSQIETFYHILTLKEQDVYFISDLDEIALQDFVIINHEVIQVDSKLAIFLKLAKGILIVDWTKYKTKHIGYNSIIDDKRRIYDLPIDPKITVISLAEERMVDDFYSRQTLIRKLPLSINANHEKLPEFTTSDSSSKIEFYSDDWQYYLFGRMKMSEAGYIYKTPEILTYLQQGDRNIVLHNAPWENREFRLALKEIERKGKIYINGQEFDFQGIKFFKNDLAFSLEGLELVEFNDKEEYCLVNKENFQDIFERYHINEGKLIIDDQPLTNKLIITENLNPGQWAHLSNIKAKIVIAKNVDNAPFTPNLDNIDSSQAKIIISNDLFLSAKAYKGKTIIYIGGETTASDLIDQISYDQDSKIFGYDLSSMAELLLNGEEVVLVGRVSQSLAKNLASLFVTKPYMMINGQRTSFTGKLTLITEEVSALNWIDKEIQTFTPEKIWEEAKAEASDIKQFEKLSNLVKDFNKLTPKPTSFSYIQICSMLRRMDLKPASNPLKHILRLDFNYVELKPILEKLWPKQSPATKPTRLEKLFTELAINPIVFIAGPSGAGKTTLMHSEEIRAQYEVLEGLEKLDELAKKSPDGKPMLLFIDEANLVAKPEIYDILHGVYGLKTVLFKGKLITLDPDAKIVLLGNYSHLKGRKYLGIIKHGSIISFKELYDLTLKIEVIEPVFSTLLQKSPNFDIIAELFIKAYHHINSLFPDKELLTPRNLEMISLRYVKLDKDKEFKRESMLKAALTIYDEVAEMLKENDRKKFEEWLEGEANIGSIKSFKEKLNKEFKIDDSFTPNSWKNSLQLMNDALGIRELKIKEQKYLKANGISAMLIEGESGIGKSYTIIKFLETKGFKDAAKYPDAPNKYHLITPTDFVHVEKTLTMAAENGDVVVIDEFNTMPLERLLNRLLSGYNLSGERLASKGLLVFATQNPISYSSRLSISDALAKRLQKVIVEPLSAEELILLLQSIADNKISYNWIKGIVNFYLEAIDYSKQAKLPIFNLRHLVKYTEEKLSSLKNPVIEVTNPEPIIIKEVKEPILDSIEEKISTSKPSSLDAQESNLPSNTNPLTSPLLLVEEKTETKMLFGYISVLNEFKESIKAFSKSIDGTIKHFIYSNYKTVLLNYIYWNNKETLALEKILKKPYIQASTSQKVQSAIKKPLVEWTKSEFDALARIVHPDKHSSYLNKNPQSLVTKKQMQEDFQTLQNFREFLKDPEKIADKLHQKLAKDLDYSTELHALNFFAKELDIAVDLGKLYLKPNIQNSFNLGRDSLMLANKVYKNSKLGYVLPVFASINVVQDIYNGEYWKAGINAIHCFSHHLINNPLLFGYGTSIYGVLNSFTIANDLHQGKYLAASIQTAGIAATYLSPTLAASIYALSYTGQNAYELHKLYQQYIYQTKLEFSKLVVKIVKNTIAKQKFLQGVVHLFDLDDSKPIEKIHPEFIIFWNKNYKEVLLSSFRHECNLKLSPQDKYLEKIFSLDSLFVLKSARYWLIEQDHDKGKIYHFTMKAIKEDHCIIHRFNIAEAEHAFKTTSIYSYQSQISKDLKLCGENMLDDVYS